MNPRAPLPRKPGWNRTGHLRVCGLLTILFVSIALTRSPAQENAKEDRFKAAYIYNFLQFIEWPDSAFTNASSPVIIGIFNRDTFGKTLKQIVESEHVNGREIRVRTLHDMTAIRGCHVLYIPASQANNIPLLLNSADSSNVLTVGEVAGFPEEGGAINFFIQDNKLRFEINPDVLKRANLHASSKLLRLARIIGSSGGGK